MSLIVTLGIIYANLHNCGLAEYHCHYCHTELATTYKQDTGREGRWRVVSQLQQQHTLDLCSVLCWPPPFLSLSARQSSVTTAHWPIPVSHGVLYNSVYALYIDYIV